MPNNSTHLDQVFQALADPTRRAVLQRLRHGPAPVGELAAPFAMALPSFLQHLRMLEASGLIRSRKQGRVRTCTLEPLALQRAEQWLQEQRIQWEARLDRLEEVLEHPHKEAAMEHAPVEYTLTRVLRAPRSRVFAMWSDAQRLRQWFGPANFHVEAVQAEFAPGGAWLCHLRMGEAVYSTGGVYKEITPEQRIVMTQHWLDADGTPGPETTITVTFADQDGGTLLTFHQTGFLSQDMRHSHEEGWGETLARLEQTLSP